MVASHIVYYNTSYRLDRCNDMLNIRLPESLENELAEEARRRNASRSEIAREALTFYLRAQRRQRYITRLQQAAQRLDDAQARALAEEGLWFDNEVLRTEPLGMVDHDGWWQ